MTLAEDFRSWANNRGNKDSRYGLALQVAEALENEELAKRWSLLDVRDEFQSRRVEVSGFSAFQQFLSVFVFLLPVGIAWLHLQDAFGAYGDSVKAAPKEVQLNFLAFWTGAYDKEEWVTKTSSASMAAMSIIGAIAVILIFQAYVSWNDGKQERADFELNELITQASLEFSRHRAVTPEELASGISDATKSLGTGLRNLRKAFDDTTELVREVQSVTGTITESARTLESASAGLVEVMKPLSNFGDTADSVSNALKQTAVAVDSARLAFERSAQSGATSIQSAGNVLASELREHAATMESVRGAVESVSVAVTTSARGLATVVDGSGVASSNVSSMVSSLAGMSEDIAMAASSLGGVVKTLMEANKNLGDVATSADSPNVQSYIIAVRNHSEAMLSAASAIEASVQHLSTQLADWSRGQY